MPAKPIAIVTGGEDARRTDGTGARHQPETLDRRREGRIGQHFREVVDEMREAERLDPAELSDALVLEEDPFRRNLRTVTP